MYSLIYISILNCKSTMKNRTHTLACGDTESQFPPTRENFPSPILAKMSFGVSFGPLAKGVCLKEVNIIGILCRWFNQINASSYYI